MARKILLADDSVTAQNMGRKILSDAGYEVITVNNGSAALKKIAEQKPDLIVLDVYMPGYSGLEVCQRIKDMRETARIPILLTVGKLEPFKPEEARKARADAYIVKPFEASELLVALTKLEDKIVPQAETYKPGRFAKAIAAVERFNHSEPEESFGDKDSGWKNRIKFPSPGSKPSEPALEEIPGKKSFREEEKPVEPPREFQRPIPEGLPKDITPEEIEAITAAAAQFSGQVQHDSSDESPPPVQAQAERGPETSLPEPVSSTIREQERAEAAQAVPGFESSAASSGPAETPEQEPHDEAPVTFAGSADSSSRDDIAAAPIADFREQIPAQTDTDSYGPVQAQEENDAVAQAATQDSAPSTNEDAAEVTTTGSEMAPPMAEPAASVSAEPSPAEPDAEIAAAVHSLASAQANAGEVSATIPADAGTLGPRWVAEPVSLEPHETTLTLEYEMHKAFAAFAAADNANATSALAEPDTTSSASPDPAAMLSNVSRAEEAEAASASETAGSSYSAEARPEELSQPAMEAQSEPLPDTGAFQEESSVQQPEAAETKMMAEASSLSPAQEHRGEDPAHSEFQDTSAKAAAWEDWEHLRDSIVGSTTQLAGAAAGPTSNSPDAEPKPEAMAAAAGAGGNASLGSEGDSSALANIVDSVLAELKPKLMEELARKMKKDSK